MTVKNNHRISSSSFSLFAAWIFTDKQQEVKPIVFIITVAARRILDVKYRGRRGMSSSCTRFTTTVWFPRCLSNEIRLCKLFHKNWNLEPSRSKHSSQPDASNHVSNLGLHADSTICLRIGGKSSI